MKLTKMYLKAFEIKLIIFASTFTVKAATIPH